MNIFFVSPITNRLSSAASSAFCSVFFLLFFTVLLNVTLAGATLYSNESFPSIDGAASGRSPTTTLPPVLPQNFIDDAGERAGFAALLNAIGEFFGHTSATRNLRTVASLYENAPDQEEATSATDQTSTVQLNIWSSAGRNDRIDVFTGANTRDMLNQLFSGILNVDEAIFDERRNRNAAGVTGGRSAAGGSVLTGSSLSSGGFLSLQSYGAERTLGENIWVRDTAIGQEFPAFEDKKTATGNDFIELIKQVFNPYFYGSLLMIVLFSIAWSMRSRMSGDHGIDG